MIHYSLEKNPDTVPNVLLIHGLFGDKDNLNSVKKAISPFYNVLSIDLPNHGNSSHIDEWTFMEVVKQLDTLLTELDFYPCSIVGHSLGGKVAMAMSLSYSDKIIKVIVADIAPVNYPPRHDNVFKALNAVKQERIEDRKQALTLLNTILVEPGVAQFLLKSLKKVDEQWLWQFNLVGLERDYKTNIIKWPFSNEQYSGPILFIKGENSDYIKQDYADKINIHFSDPSYKMVSDTGHWLHAEKPAIFNRLVIRMLDGD